MRAQVPGRDEKQQRQQCKNDHKDVDPHDIDSRLSRKTPTSTGARRPQNPQTTSNAPKREFVLPWETFLPTKGQDSGKKGWSDNRASNKKQEFKELLDEGKKRLEKAGQEQQLRERGEVLSTMGSVALEDLLADLREPSFSRRQNEKLRHGIAVRLRTKIARLYGCVMSQYATRTDATLRSADDGMARATAAFRVKLNRLLDHSFLGEIQNQVTKELAGAPSVSAALVRQRECCKSVSQRRSKENGSPTSNNVRASARNASGATTVRVNTAPPHHVHSKPHPPKRKSSTAISAVAISVASSTSGRRGTANNVRNRQQEATGSMAGDGQNEDSRCSDTIAEDEKRRYGESNHGNDPNTTSAPEDRGSLAEIEVSVCSPNTTPPLDDEFLGGSPSSEESFDFYDGETLSQSDGDSDGSGISSLSGGDGEQIIPSSVETGNRNVPHQAGDNKLADQAESEARNENDEEMADGDNERVRKGPGEKRNSSDSRRSRRNKKKKDAAQGAEDGGSSATVSGTRLDEAWSNRWLTVLLTELGIHQSHQRTVLAEHMPEMLEKGCEAQDNWPKPPPLSRIDRPHFSPAFAELPAAGKGLTLLMCPEPVAPGYEYADVFEEVVKLHPPVGQLVLEEIKRGNIMTRSDALAHVETIERSAEPNHAKVLVDEFMAEEDVKDILASAEILDLDLANCAASGTLLNNEDVP